jgi:hypothetical protein
MDFSRKIEPIKEEPIKRDSKKVGAFKATRDRMTKQLNAMGCDLYEIGIHDRNKHKHNTVLKPKQTKEKILGKRYIKLLRGRNWQNKDIWIRPCRSQMSNLILIDDVLKSTIDNVMKKEGWEPALVVETSPANYQAWIKLHEPVNSEVQRAIAQLGQQLFKGDVGSTSKEHFGRLAGFTNRKPCHNQNGLYPFAHVTESTGKEATGSERIIISEAKKLVTKAKAALAEVMKREAEKPKEAVSTLSENSIDKWWIATDDTIRGRGTVLDQSRLDFSMATMLSEKNCSIDQISEAIQRNSPDLDERKKGYETEYADRTAIRADIWAKAKAQGKAWTEVKGGMDEAVNARLAARRSPVVQSITTPEVTSTIAKEKPLGPRAEGTKQPFRAKQCNKNIQCSHSKH